VIGAAPFFSQSLRSRWASRRFRSSAAATPAPTTSSPRVRAASWSRDVPHSCGCL